VHHDHPVRGGVHVGLQVLVALVDRAPERRQRVLHPREVVVVPPPVDERTRVRAGEKGVVMHTVECASAAWLAGARTVDR
jgi:hypothetical protein